MAASGPTLVEVPLTGLSFMIMPPLEKDFPAAILTRSGGEVLITVSPATCPNVQSRWSFSISSKTNKKGAMRATVEYGPDTDFKNRMKVQRPIEDFTEDDLGGLVCQMVDKQTGQTGSSLWRPPIFRSVDYAAKTRTGESFLVSVQARKMQLDSSTFAPEPCTAEIIRGRRQSSLLETTANGLNIDDAYDALVRSLHWAENRGP